MSQEEAEVNFEQFDVNNDPLDELLKTIAKSCVSNNWHRTDNHDAGWHYFTDSELKEMNRLVVWEYKYNGGYCFLDEKGGKEGMIRLYAGNANPKWCFELEKDGEITYDLA